MNNTGTASNAAPAIAPARQPGESVRRILVVDDEADARQLIVDVMVRSGYEVVAVKDGVAGWEALQAYDYDLIITDNIMPKVTGLEMIEQLRSASMALPVIMATGFLPTHEFVRRPWLKPDIILEKPFSNDDLLAAVKTLLPPDAVHQETLPAIEKETKADDQAGSVKSSGLTTEQALVASELSYRRLFEAAKDGILILDVDTGRITDVNRFLIKLLGFSRNEIVGKTVGELSPFKDVVSNQAMLELLQKDGYVRYEDLPLETRDGRHIAVEFVSNVYEAGDKKVIQCNIRDITERKHAELVFKELAAIVEYSNDAIIGKTPDGIITSWNHGAEKIFGYAASEIIGQPLSLLVPADRQQEEMEILEKIRQGESLRHFETVRQTKDGSLINVSVTVSPIKDDKGKIVGVSKVARDITERKVAEEKIFRLNIELEQRVAERTAQLQAANQELDAFSYTVSHDLRAPLRHIMGFIELLQKDAGPMLSGSSLQHLATISQAAKRMGKLIDDLLAFSRVGQSKMQKQEVDLEGLVREVWGDFQGETKERSIVWKIRPLPPVSADRALLRMVLVNLISNAVKFTSGRAEAVIEIGCAPGGDNEDVIFIRDNGAGFDPKYTQKLFGVFQRLHSHDEFEGTGIGLANVQHIIHRHGGRTWAEGLVDGGATFYFSLPKQNGVGNGK